MPMLIENAGGAPPSGPGSAPSVLVATSFQCVTSASAPVGGAADALDTPTAPRSPPTDSAMTTTDRLRTILLTSPSTAQRRLSDDSWIGTRRKMPAWHDACSG